MKYLVTGRAASGKTTVNAELRRRGYNSLDTDDAKIARWEDAKTGEPVDVDPSGFVDYSKVAWNWVPGALHKVLETPDELFVCGSASNDLEFFRLFDKVFVLALDQETQRRRLQNRSSLYGKDRLMQSVIIQEQTGFVMEAIERGAFPIEAAKPIDKVVDKILEIVADV